MTTLEFDLRVTSPTGVRWSHGNTQGETAATRSDVAAFACADEPEAAADLIVSGVTVSDATPVAGETITLRATVRNRGDGPATATTLRFYRSNDSTISASGNSDSLISSEAVGALAASATESRTFHFRVPSVPGTFYLGACVDSVSSESRTGNNCSDGVRVVVEEEPEAAPDLIVSAFSVNDENPAAGGLVQRQATVENDGDGRASVTTLRYYRSTDSTIGPADIEVGNAAVGELSASATQSLTFASTVPSSHGSWFYLGACIDSVSNESDSGNNCSDGVLVNVRERGSPVSDLTVSAFSVSDENPVGGAVVHLQATVKNDGDELASVTTLRYYQSANSYISTGDTELDSEEVEALAASATQSLTLDFTVPSTPGMFYLGACVDSVSNESDGRDNCSDGVLVAVR